ncbi:hypothetical protein [Streptomyces sp. NPDC056227]|uniref:hypothetical protein n=1 Tax=Streptomyces sp. NPDC056227 TaxID=3345753 RepID=UPI0035DDA56C
MTTQQAPNANDFLMGGGGAPSASFPTPGTKIGGTITEQPTVQQQRDLDGKPKFWDDGNPQMQLVVTIQTEQRDPSIEDDDGRRRLFVKGQMKNAVADAVRAAGAPGLQVGGTLDVAYTHDGVPKRGFNAPKQYAARYTPVAANLLNSGATQGAPVADPWATQTAPAATAPPVAPAQQALHAQQQAAGSNDVPF